MSKRFVFEQSSETAQQVSESAPLARGRQGDWMQTYTGIQFWPIDPRASEICIEDIAHALANQCRFAGHVTRFYSVAQHSVLISRHVPPENALWGLLHDASEAYLVDLPRPVKRFSDMGALYKVIEARLMLSVCERFGLSPDEPTTVKHADDVLLMTEKRDLMPNSPAKWRETAEPLPEAIEPWSPERARAEFLQRAADLGVAPLRESRYHFPPTEGPNAEGLTVEVLDEGVTG